MKMIDLKTGQNFKFEGKKTVFRFLESEYRRPGLIIFRYENARTGKKFESFTNEQVTPES